MGAPETARRRYETLKADQRCVSCGGPLAPEDGCRCATCTEVARPTQEIYRLSDHGRAVRRKAQEDHYTRRYDAGVCVICCAPRSTWVATTPAQAARIASDKPPQRCPICTRAHSEYKKRTRALKRQGVTSLEAARRRRDRDERTAEARARRAELERQLTAYTPPDEVPPRLLALRALRHHDWTAAAELWDLLGINSAWRSPEADRFRQALSRASRGEDRTIDRRGTRGEYEYRINERGRAELEKESALCAIAYR